MHGIFWPVNYFEAKSAQHTLKRFRQLAIDYWYGLDQKAKRMTTSEEESKKLLKLREEISKLRPVVDRYAASLGIATIINSYPPPAIGGPVLRASLLGLVIDQHVGYGSASKGEIIDKVDECIGMTENLQRRLLWREALNPFWYLIRGIAMLIRVPFVILEHAGLPQSVEESLWGHIIKVVLVIALLPGATYFGVKLTLGDVLKVLK